MLHTAAPQRHTMQHFKNYLKSDKSNYAVYLYISYAYEGLYRQTEKSSYLDSAKEFADYAQKQDDKTGKMPKMEGNSSEKWIKKEKRRQRDSLFDVFSRKKLKKEEKIFSRDSIRKGVSVTNDRRRSKAAPPSCFKRSRDDTLS